MTRRIFLTLLAATMLFVLPSRAQDAKPINVLIITGDHGHDWKATTPFLKDLLTKAGMKVDVTETPSKDLTTDNLAKYDVLFLNYKDTPKGAAESKWSDENKKAFTDAVKGGKGLVSYHYASAAFITGDENWQKEFERIIAGGWRKQGYHGARHVYEVTNRKPDHPAMKGAAAKFTHAKDELYQNSVIFPDSIVLATAYSDAAKDPKNTGKDEPVIWVAMYGEGRVYNNVLGHDLEAMANKEFQELIVRGTEWAATGEVKSAGK